MLGICCSCQTAAEITRVNGQTVMAAHAFANGEHGIFSACDGEGTVPQALTRKRCEDCHSAHSCLMDCQALIPPN